MSRVRRLTIFSERKDEPALRLSLCRPDPRRRDQIDAAVGQLELADGGIRAVRRLVIIAGKQCRLAARITVKIDHGIQVAARHRTHPDRDYVACTACERVIVQEPLRRDLAVGFAALAAWLK